MLLADGPCLITKALCKGDTLRVPVALDVIDKIVQVQHVKNPAGRQATASMQWRSNYADMLMPLLRLLARWKKMDGRYAPSIKCHSKDGFAKTVDLTRPPGLLTIYGNRMFVTSLCRSACLDIMAVHISLHCLLVHSFFGYHL